MSWHRADGTARLARIVVSGFPTVLGLSVLGDGSVVLAGSFADTTTFGPSDATKVSYTATGSENTFLARLKP